MNEHGSLQEKYNIIWNKSALILKKKIDSEPVYNKTFLKSKTKCYGDEASFHDK